MKNKITRIGEADSISGNTITVKLSDNIKSEMPVIDGVVYRAGQLGSFLKIPLGYTNVYGIVTQIGSNAIPDSLKEAYVKDYENAKNLKFVSMVLVGEQTGIKFERGITQFPSPGDAVHIVTLDDLEIIYGGYSKDSSIVVGNISVSESLEARIDLDKLISRHCAILGSTGSGKSNAVGVLIKSIANKDFLSARILIIDPHGEYDEVLKNHSRVFKIKADKNKGEEELYIPYWALSLNELLRIFPGNLSDQGREYFRSKVYEEKVESLYLLQWKTINDKAVSADSPIPFSINKLWFELDDFERRTLLKDRVTLTNLIESGDYKLWKSNLYTAAAIGGGEPFLNNASKGILSYLDNMRSKCLDKRYSFLFQPDKWNPKFEGKWDDKVGNWESGIKMEIKKDFDELLFNWVGGEKPITILDLSDVPPEIMTSISGTLLNIIYDALFWGQNEKMGGKKQPLLIVLEEAHNYLKSGENSIASRTVQRIAKEGRKYGVGLALVTQRPSELDETVLSQCGTLIALRMNNSKDRSHITGAIQDELQKLVDLLPSLRTGEGIITGEAVKIPTRAMFYKLDSAPKSSDPKASVEWKKEKPVPDDYKKAINNWRNQTF